MPTLSLSIIATTLALWTGVLHNPGTMEAVWSVATEGPVRGGGAFVDDLVLFGSTDGRLYALGREDGGVQWTYATGGSIPATPAIAGNLVIAPSRDGRIHAVDAATGDARWAFEMEQELPYAWGFDAYLSSPRVVGDAVYVGSGDGNLYRLDAATGTARWAFPVGARVRSTPDVTDGLVIVGAVNGIVYAVDAETGRERWRFETAGAALDPANFGFDRRGIVSSAVVTDGVAVIGGRDGFVYGLDHASGDLLWTSDHNVSWIVATPLIHDGTVYVGSSDAAFVQALDLTTGQERWRVPAGGIVWSSPVLVDERLYVGVGTGNLLALDAASGEIEGRFRTAGDVLARITYDGQLLYVGSDDGRFYALRPLSAPAGTLARAVFWDEAFESTWFRPGVDRHIRDAFARAGYDVLDADELASFMRGRIADRQTSVVVFAANAVPAQVLAPDTTASVLFRQYLDVGRAVWLGSTPLAFVRNAEGTLQGLDYAVPPRVTGMRYGGPDLRGMGGFYRAAPTEEGRKWGLTGWWITRNAIGLDQVTEALALDEYGLASLWYRRYSGPPGSGLVQLWVDRKAPGPLGPIIQASEHGLL